MPKRPRPIRAQDPRGALKAPRGCAERVPGRSTRTAPTAEQLIACRDTEQMSSAVSAKNEKLWRVAYIHISRRPWTPSPPSRARAGSVLPAAALQAARPCMHDARLESAGPLYGNDLRLARGMQGWTGVARTGRVMRDGGQHAVDLVTLETGRIQPPTARRRAVRWVIPL